MNTCLRISQIQIVINTQNTCSTPITKVYHNRLPGCMMCFRKHWKRICLRLNWKWNHCQGNYDRFDPILFDQKLAIKRTFRTTKAMRHCESRQTRWTDQMSDGEGERHGQRIDKPYRKDTACIYWLKVCRHQGRCYADVWTLIIVKPEFLLTRQPQHKDERERNYHVFFDNLCLEKQSTQIWHTINVKCLELIFHIGKWMSTDCPSVFFFLFPLFSARSVFLHFVYFSSNNFFITFYA